VVNEFSGGVAGAKNPNRAAGAVPKGERLKEQAGRIWLTNYPMAPSTERASIVAMGDEAGEADAGTHRKWVGGSFGYRLRSAPIS